MANKYFWGAILAMGIGLSLTLFGCSSDTTKEQAQLNLQIGTSHLSAGRYPQALAALLHAQSLDPQNPVILNNLGLAYYVRKEYAPALKYISAALDINPKYSDARNNRGRIYIELGRYGEAITDLSIVTKDL